MRLLILLFTLVPFSYANSSSLENAVEKEVLSKIHCKNPLYVLEFSPKGYDLEAELKATQRPPISVSKVKISPSQFAFRIDYEGMGNGNYRSYHQSFFVVNNQELVHLQTFSGPYIFISNEVENGYYKLWHWSNYPLSREKKYLIYSSLHTAYRSRV